MLQIHLDPRTAPITRAEIARSYERAGVLAQRHGVSTETIPQVAQAWDFQLPGPLGAATSAVLKSK